MKGPIPVARLACGAVVLAHLTFWLAAPADARAALLTSDQLPIITIAVEDESGASSWSYTPSLQDVRPTAGTRGWSAVGLPDESSVLDGRAQVEIQALEFDLNPFVLNNILITNTTSVTQIFTVGVALPTTFEAPNLISGSVLASVIDGGTDGATLAAVADQSIYSAQIDFANVATLQGDPFSLIAAPGDLNSANASFGPDVNAIPVTANIGIQLRFSLSAGDTAAMLSRFDVIPEPGALALLAAFVPFLLRQRASRQ